MIASEPGRYVARLEFPGNILNAGLYRLGIGIAVQGRAIDRHDVTFHVLSGQSFERKSILLMPLPWQIETK